MKNNSSSGVLRRQVLESSDLRDQLYLQHPLVTDRLFLSTGPVRRAYESISICITHRDSGLCFVGAPRTGKSYSIEVLRETIQKVFPKLVVLSANAKLHQSVTEKAFFGDLLEDVGLRFEERNTAFVRRQRFKQHIKTRCSQLDSSIVLLFIDEAQIWGEMEFTFLRDIINDLIKFDSITVIVTLFGSSEILQTRAFLTSRNRTDLVGRYLRDPVALLGLQSLEDVSSVLGQCDDPTLHEYPDYSGVALSQFFFPLAYASGWRLASEAPLLWRALLAELHVKPNQNVTIGMAWVMSSVRDFIFQAGQQGDSDDFCGSETMWQAAVRCGRYSSLQNTF